MNPGNWLWNDTTILLFLSVSILMVVSYIKSKFITFSEFQSLCSKKIVYSNGAAIPRPCIGSSSSLWRTSFSNHMVPVICLFGVKHIYLRRFYHTNPYYLLYQPLHRAIVHLKRRMMIMVHQRWTKNKGNKWITFLLGACIVITICFGRIERTPYSRRFHVSLSERTERKLSDFLWERFKREHQAEILPPSDPTSIRVQAIATKIIQALNNGFRLEHECKINGHALKSVGSILKDELASKFSTSGDLKGNFGSEDGKGIEKSQKQARKLLWKPSTKHLNGKSWEVYVVDSIKVNACCLYDGRIVVHRSWLSSFMPDAYLATVIGHEVAHAVARYWAEALLESPWLFTFLVILVKSVPASIAPTLAILILFNAFVKYLSRRREVEADYIGLMLMASAGYDPRQAPKLYEKFGDAGGIFATHPSGSKRAKLLSKPKVMREAIATYEEVRSGHGVRSFF